MFMWSFGPYQKASILVNFLLDIHVQRRQRGPRRRESQLPILGTLNAWILPRGSVSFNKGPRDGIHSSRSTWKWSGALSETTIFCIEPSLSFYASLGGLWPLGLLGILGAPVLRGLQLQGST